jgi:hypothetical protein
VKFSVYPSILLNNIECSPLGVNEGVNFTPRGHISPLGAKLAPRDEIHPWGPGVKLRMALRGSLIGRGYDTAAAVFFNYNNKGAASPPTEQKIVGSNLARLKGF